MEEEAWVKWLIFPRAILPATAPKPSTGQSLGQAVKERLRRWRAGEEAALWLEAVKSTTAQVRKGRKKTSTQSMRILTAR